MTQMSTLIATLWGVGYFREVRAEPTQLQCRTVPRLGIPDVVPRGDTQDTRSQEMRFEPWP